MKKAYLEKIVKGNKSVSPLHKNSKYVEKFTGNYLFASSNSCKGMSKSRKDDLESVVYLLIYLLNNNKLPWALKEGQQLSKLIQ